jgi:hypothetical protein
MGRNLFLAEVTVRGHRIRDLTSAALCSVRSKRGTCGELRNSVEFDFGPQRCHLPG